MKIKLLYISLASLILLVLLGIGAGMNIHQIKTDARALADGHGNTLHEEADPGDIGLDAARTDMRPAKTNAVREPGVGYKSGNAPSFIRNSAQMKTTAERGAAPDPAAWESHSARLAVHASRPVGENVKARSKDELVRDARRAGNEKMFAEYVKKYLESADWKELIIDVTQPQIL
jgi:hypothetical protein